MKHLEALGGVSGGTWRSVSWHSLGGDIMGIEYLCKSWQALLECVVLHVGNGFDHYHVTILPEGKRSKWGKIDEKMIEKYNAAVGKDVRYRTKKLGLTVFRYVRWEHVAIVLRSPGDVIDSDGTLYKDGIKRPEYILNSSGRFKVKQLEKYSVQYDDSFSDIRQRPLPLRISDQVFLEVRYIKKAGKGDQATVTMQQNFYNEKKYGLEEILAKTKNKDKVFAAFDMLNGFPAWRGIVLQKREIQQFLTKEARKHGVQGMNAKAFPFISVRKKIEENLYV